MYTQTKRGGWVLLGPLAISTEFIPDFKRKLSSERGRSDTFYLLTSLYSLAVHNRVVFRRKGRRQGKVRIPW